MLLAWRAAWASAWVLVWWQGWQSSCRLVRLWLSPGGDVVDVGAGVAALDAAPSVSGDDAAAEGVPVAG